MSKTILKIALIPAIIALAFPTHDLLTHLIKGRMLRVQRTNYNFSRYIRSHNNQQSQFYISNLTIADE